MVSKPPSDWYREDRGVEAARQAGGVALKALSAGASGVVRVYAAFRAVMSAAVALCSGLAALGAGLTGANIPVAIMAGCCSLLMGWVAVRNARIALGDSRPNREEPVSVPGTADFRSRQDPWASPGGEARYKETNGPRGESRIYYNRNKLFVRAASSFIMCAVFVWLLTGRLHQGLSLILFALPVLGFLLWRLVGLLLLCTDKDLTAVSWDQRQIRIRTLTSTRQVPWQSVESVQSFKRVVRVNFIIPVSKSYEMVFRLRHNGSRRKMTIRSGDLTISPAAADQLVQLALRLARVGNQNERTNDLPDFGSRRTAANPDPVFAHDAAEHARTFGADDQPTAVPRSFGRKVV